MIAVIEGIAFLIIAGIAGAAFAALFLSDCPYQNPSRARINRLMRNISDAVGDDENVIGAESAHPSTIDKFDTE